MRQIHKAGEKCFVDYAGQTMSIINGTTGEITEAQIFVAVFGNQITTHCHENQHGTIDPSWGDPVKVQHAIDIANGVG